MPEDDLNRAVDARIDAFLPATVPAFASLQARKRARDRRRAVTGGAALSVSAVAAVVALTAGLGGGPDRLQVPGGIAGPAATPTVGIVDDGPQRYSISYTDASAYLNSPDGQDALVQACMDLPGTSERGIQYSDPPQYGVTVTGVQAVAAFTSCIKAIDNVTLTTVGISRPAVVEPSLDPAAGPLRIFTVSAEFESTFRPDPATYTAAVEKCLELPGVTGSSVQESYPATYELSASGGAAELLDRCLRDIPGAKVVMNLGTVAQDADVQAFIDKCVGAQSADAADEYVGLDEDAVDRATVRGTANPVRSFRVIGRDGQCLGRDDDLRSDRVNLLVVDGKVVWAGRF